MLFGSVARGDAVGGSDIDMVAIFADLDYGERAARRQKLEAVAAEVVSWPVQVHVTDRPEWRWRTRRVCSSFEASVAGEAVPLIDSVVGEVRWDKEIGLAKTNDEEALDRLNDACGHFIAMRSDLRPDSAATWMGRPLPPEEVVAAEHVRIGGLCVAAAGAIELTVKALRAAAGGEALVVRDGSGPCPRVSRRILGALRRAAQRRRPRRLTVPVLCGTMTRCVALAPGEGRAGG